MASNVAGFNIYQFQSQTPVPLNYVGKLYLPFSAIRWRAINGTDGLLLSTGVQVYTAIQEIATGTQYLVIETPAAIAALSN